MVITRYKIFEGQLNINMYSVIQNIKSGYICLIETNHIKHVYIDDGSFFIRVKSILPESASFEIYNDEFGDNIYQDENNTKWKFIYSSKDFDEAKEQYNFYTSSKKFNL